MQTEYLFAFAPTFTVDSLSPGPAVATVLAKGSTIGLAGYTACAERAGRLLTSERARRWLKRRAAGTIVGAAGTIDGRTSMIPRAHGARRGASPGRCPTTSLPGTAHRRERER